MKGNLNLSQLKLLERKYKEDKDIIYYDELYFEIIHIDNEGSEVGKEYILAHDVQNDMWSAYDLYKYLHGLEKDYLAIIKFGYISLADENGNVKGFDAFERYDIGYYDRETEISVVNSESTDFL